MYNLEDLDQDTRRYMLEVFDKEESGGNPYRSKSLTLTGQKHFYGLMKNAILDGNETTLAQSLNYKQFWKHADLRGRKINILLSSKKLASVEFNTWYVRGLSRRLINDKEEYCEIYSAEPAYVPRGDCAACNGSIIKVRDVYFGHRAKYWPKSNPSAFSIPTGPDCHYTIRRIKKPECVENTII